MRATGLDWGAAEAQKHALRIPRHPDEASAEWDGEGERTDTQIGQVSPEAPIAAIAARAVREAVEEWVTDVRGDLIAMEEETGLGLDEVLLCGGGARMEGLGELLAAQLGVSARPVAVPGGYPIDSALAVALARVAAGELKATDLRVDAFAYHGYAETLWSVVSYATVGAAVAMAAGVAMGVFQIGDATQRQADLEQQITESVLAAFPDLPPDRVSDPTMAVALLKERVVETTARVDALGSTVSGTPPTLDMLKLLSERLPPHKEARIDVRELNFSEASLSLKAETDSYESAAKIEEALVKEKRFSEAKKSDEKKVGDALIFSLNIPLGGTVAGPEEEG